MNYKDLKNLLKEVKKEEKANKKQEKLHAKEKKIKEEAKNKLWKKYKKKIKLLIEVRDKLEKPLKDGFCPHCSHKLEVMKFNKLDLLATPLLLVFYFSYYLCNGCDYEYANQKNEIYGTKNKPKEN